MREGGVAPLDIDAGWPAWSGVVPIETRLGAPIADDVVGARAMGLDDRAAPVPAGRTAGRAARGRGQAWGAQLHASLIEARPGPRSDSRWPAGVGNG